MKTALVRNTPSDPTLPKVPVVINGKTYFLVWDFNSLAAAESLSGQNLLRALNFDGITALQLRGLFFAALLKFHGPKKDAKGNLSAGITLEEAGGLLKDNATCEIVIGKLVEAYYGSMPDPGADEDKKSPNEETPESR